MIFNEVPIPILFQRLKANLIRRHGSTRSTANVRHERRAQAGKTRRSMSARWKGLGIIALQDGAFLLVGKDLLSHVVDHHGTFEVGYGWISAVLLSDE